MDTSIWSSGSLAPSVSALVELAAMKSISESHKDTMSKRGSPNDH